MKRNFAFGALILAFTCSFSTLADAQKRDYLTDDEIEIVRDAQQMDKRIDVLIQAIDRRFALLGTPVIGGPKVNEFKNKWGKEPEGSRTELLYDIRQLMQKAIDDIDNLSSRPDSIVVELPSDNEKPKTFQQVFPVAVRHLASAAERYQPILETFLTSSKDERERGVLLSIGEMCSEIIAAREKLPAETKKK